MDLDLTDQQFADQSRCKSPAQDRCCANNGAPIAMSAWIDDVAAVLEGWMMGSGAVWRLPMCCLVRSIRAANLLKPPAQTIGTLPTQLAWRGGRSALRRRTVIGYRFRANRLPVRSLRLR